MTATYQNNIKKLAKHLKKPLTEIILNYDPRAYPNHEHELLHSNLWHGFDPWKDNYSSPLTHICLYQVTNISQIEDLPIVLVRDGLFMLLEFFMRSPNPKKMEGLILVHRCLRDYVPEAWRAKTLFYEIEYKGNQENVFKQKNNQALLKANITDGIFDYETTKSQILALKKLKYEKFNFFFFNRSNPLLALDWDNDHRTIEYIISQNNFISFLNKEKIQHEFLTWKEYYHVQNMHQYDCLDLNFKEKYFIDDFTNYYFIKKGASPINVNEAKASDADIYVPISAFHGIRVLGKEPNYTQIKAKEIEKNLKYMDCKVKFDTGTFQMIDDITGDKLESAWPKRFT